MVAVVVVGVVGRVVTGVRVMIVAKTRRKAFGGGKALVGLLLAIAGTLTFAIVVGRTCQRVVRTCNEITTHNKTLQIKAEIGVYQKM